MPDDSLRVAERGLKSVRGHGGDAYSSVDMLLCLLLGEGWRCAWVSAAVTRRTLAEADRRLVRLGRPVGRPTRSDRTRASLSGATWQRGRESCDQPKEAGRGLRVPHEVPVEG